MKKAMIIMAALMLLAACSRNGSLADVAVKRLPASLDLAMREQMGTVERPKIKDVKVIYDCDSICVVQCKAGAKDVYGKTRNETVRYFFVKDMFMSRATGVPTYGDLVVGGKYLKGKEISEFRKEMTDKAKGAYMYYLSASRSVD